MKLHDKVALITGSARGLGWEMVQAFVQEGARVAICDLSQSDIDGAAARLGLPPEKVLGVKADVTSERDVGDLLSRTLEKFKRLDILVNNAGFAWPRGGPVNLELAETPLDVWLKILDTNLNGTFLCSREALKTMRPQGSGSIVNISSPQGKKGKLLRGPYCAAKFGVLGLTESLAKDLSSYKINVNAVCPGYTVTHFYDPVLAVMGMSTTMEDPAARSTVEQMFASKSLFGKMIAPEDIAAAVLFLSSDISSNMTGTYINVSGGARMP